MLILHNTNVLNFHRKFATTFLKFGKGFCPLLFTSCFTDFVPQHNSKLTMFEADIGVAANMKCQSVIFNTLTAS